jgi:hypothetical protein
VQAQQTLATMVIAAAVHRTNRRQLQELLGVLASQLQRQLGCLVKWQKNRGQQHR